MPEIKEEVLIDIKLDQDEGQFKKLADLKGTILGLKEEQKNLAKALKDGAITQKEYNSEIVRVEALNKKTQASYNEVQRSVTGLKNPLNELNKNLKEQPKLVQAAGNAFAPIAGIIAGAFSIGAVTNFIKGLFNITAEFQKFSAVLTNTLGSGSQAQEALGMIQKFASETPFSVKELTDSFVKLANQGFVPTKDEMRKLGDLASSTGKSFDQLSEGILDAQTGQFERLKEFGIKAKKEGDNVTFSFKGVETQVAFTSDAMREYVLSLGDVAGVSGSMAAISETLGGKISNLGDSWDTLLKTLGEGNNGIFSGAINFLNESVQDLTTLFETSSQREQRLSTERRVNIKEDFNAFAEAFNKKEDAYRLEFKRIEEDIEKSKIAGDGKITALENEKRVLKELQEQDEIARVKKEESERKLEEQRIARSSAEIKRKEDELKKLEEKAFKESEIERNARIAEVERENLRLSETDFRNEAEIEAAKALSDSLKEINASSAEAFSETSKSISDNIAKANKDAENSSKVIAIAEESKQVAWRASANALGSLSNLFKENSIAAKVLGSAEVIINTAVGISRALASKAAPFIEPFATATRIASAFTIGASGAAALAKINGVSFYEGGFGYTGSGNPKHESRALGIKPYTYHKDEYITPSRILNTPEGSYHVGQLEAMRTGKKSFESGGFSGGGGMSQSQFNALIDKINTVQSVLVVEKFEEVQGRRIEVRERATF